ncbi:hypothetical protein ACLKA6_006600 [Drosophila palustris]
MSAINVNRDTQKADQAKDGEGRRGADRRQKADDSGSEYAAGQEEEELPQLEELEELEELEGTGGTSRWL